MFVILDNTLAMLVIIETVAAHVLDSTLQVFKSVAQVSPIFTLEALVILELGLLVFIILGFCIW